jgi:hypothetical protein
MIDSRTQPTPAAAPARRERNSGVHVVPSLEHLRALADAVVNAPPRLRLVVPGLRLARDEFEGLDRLDREELDED